MNKINKRLRARNDSKLTIQKYLIQNKSYCMEISVVLKIVERLVKLEQMLLELSHQCKSRYFIADL